MPIQLPDLKDLEKVIDLCRKKGVDAITLGDIRLELGAAPEKKPRGRAAKEKPEHDPINPYANFPDGTLTPEQLIHYSSGGTTDDDPVLNGFLRVGET